MLLSTLIKLLIDTLSVQGDMRVKAWDSDDGEWFHAHIDERGERATDAINDIFRDGIWITSE